MSKVLRALICGVLLLPTWGLTQQGAIITGKVTNAAGDPLPGANVFIELTNLGSATDVDGKYTFTVPAKAVKGQQIKLTARYIGYHSKTDKIALNPGTVEKDFSLAEDVLDMAAIVVTGVVGETPREKLAFTVARVEKEALELVPATTAIAGIQGKVPGAKVIKNSGRPGSGYSVKLRGATSINTTGRTAQPLYVVDGVILGANQIDVDALDIESVEVVKGAAASSLYGSRAANGVVQIKTSRGKELGLDETRITIRNEFGFNQLEKKIELSKHHEFKINANGQFVDNSGNVIDFGDAVLDGASSNNAFQDNPFPGQLYDNMDLFFDPGNFYTNYASISRNTRNTNYRLSFTNLDEAGVITGLEGYNRKNVRLNLDHHLRSGIDLSITGYYASSKADGDFATGENPNPFYGLMFLNPTANLLEPNADGQPYKIQPDPRTLEENPLYAINFAELVDKRQRIQGSVSLRYAPFDWVSTEGNFSYDRSDRNNSEFYPRGFKTIDAGLKDGRFIKDNYIDEAINASVTATLTRAFGDLTTRTQLRYLIENTNYNRTYTRGNNLTVGEVRDLGAVRGDKDINSELEEVKSVGYYFITGIDYRDKYIADFLVRRDGSSLFGPEQRYHNYFRFSGAYRLSLEPWWFTDKINEFKLRYSYGTAGGRPRFSGQYETFDIASGVVSKATLGNKALKPEYAIEQEVGLNMTFFDRFGLDLTYADSKVEDQLLLVPLSVAAGGFPDQWQNAGTLESNTFEASLQASILRSRNMSWSATLNFDRTRQKITEFNLPPYRGGASNAFYFRNNETYGVFYGKKWITNANALPASARPFADKFQVNDDGYLVPVGAGNSWRDGISKNLWGTRVDVNGDGAGDYDWGLPLIYVDEKGSDFHKLGSVVPDFNLALASDFKWKGFTLHMLLDAEIGADIYNQTRQWSYRELRHGDVDQSGKSDELKKPVGYYAKLYDVNTTNSHFVEDGTYLKVRELSLHHTWQRSQLKNLFGGFFGTVFNRVTLGVIGRNLFTFTDYSGFDPEVGLGDATLERFDGFRYPNYRTITGILEFEL